MFKWFIKSEKGGTSSAFFPLEVLSLQITDIKIRRIEGFSRLKAIASITLDKELIINDIKVLESKNRCFIEFPKNSFAKTHNRENIIPTSELRTTLENKIMELYNQMQMLNIDSYSFSKPFR